MTTVAVAQLSWTGDASSMLDKSVEAARSAAHQGAHALCFQELFCGPYFCSAENSRHQAHAELVPDGPTTGRMAALARELGLVLVVPLYETDTTGLYNTAVVINADGTYLGKYRKHHIPDIPGFREKFYFRPGDKGWPVFDTAAGRIGVYICYDRHFPEGWRALGLGGAQIVFNPSATSRSLSQYLWHLEQPAAAVANQYFVAAINRVGREEAYSDNDYYGGSYICDPFGRFIGPTASETEDEIVVRELDLTLIEAAGRQWQFFEDRRPDAYGALAASLA